MKGTAASPGERIPEFTIQAVVLGVILVLILTAANAYIGLYAGMTVSASIPAAVISMAIFRGVLRRGTLLENNIVQTIASAGESIAAGVIFTVPALVIAGAWIGFAFWPTVIITLSGGLLGVILSIPLRRALVIEEKELKYPEGVACAEVIRAGESKGGFLTVLKGFALGGVFKFFFSAFHAARAPGGGGRLEAALNWRGSLFFLGCDVSPALIGVGYIVGFEISLILLLGGAATWCVAVPLTAAPGFIAPGGELQAVWDIWSGRVRYLGVGAMLVGGLWSVISIRRGLASGLKALLRRNGSGDGAVLRTDENLPMRVIILLALLACGLMFLLYSLVIGNRGMAAGLTVGIAALCVFAVAVSSYVVGLVGSSNNPVSGITICCLMIVAGLLFFLGMRGGVAVAASLCVAGVVCCAACAAGDMSQDLKTGYILGATPRLQQWGQILGVVIASLILAPVLTLLHSAYGIGTGLRAPQATLFAGITRAIFGDSSLPVDMLLGGIAIGAALVAVNLVLAGMGKKFRLHVMPFAVGMYLPLTLTIPMFLGGTVSLLVRRTGAGNASTGGGILLSSGMIAGEAVMGIATAVFIVSHWDYAIAIGRLPETVLSVLALGLALWYLFRVSRKKD